MAPAGPSLDMIRRAVGEFQLTVGELQVAQIQRYMGMFLTWNDKINISAIRDPLEILYRHFCESMYAASAVPLTAGRLADIGSGGGFPGLPLKIVRPELDVFVIESNVKKATFLAEVVRELGLTRTNVLVSRYEELGEEVAPLDVVCSRAVGQFVPLLTWAGSARIGARQAVLWVGQRDVDEVQKVQGWAWKSAIPIPKSLRRVILVGDRK
jgi:16S rRNA (guanine527-N7)-methyltransferase